MSYLRQEKKKSEVGSGKNNVNSKPKGEYLTNLLVNKFKTKYSNELKDHTLEALVMQQISNFVAEGNLTEQNLAKLDLVIASVIKNEPKPASAKNDKPDENRSQSAKSSISQKSKDIKSEVSNQEESASVKDKDDWAQVVEYNTMLHHEQQKVSKIVRKDNKDKMKSELEKQVEDKKKKQINSKKQESAIELKQVKMEKDIEANDKIKELKHRELVVQQKKESQLINESKN